MFSRWLSLGVFLGLALVQSAPAFAAAQAATPPADPPATDILAKPTSPADEAALIPLCSKDLFWASKKERVKIDSFHQRLICGDRDNPAWDEIPFYQAEFHLKAYLQSNGYFAASVNRDDKARLIVHSGPRLHLQALVLEPDLKDLRYDLEFYHGRVLTPDLLNLLEARAKLFFRNRGYACLTLESKVVIESGTVHLVVKPGEIYKFGIVAREKLPELDGRVFERFDPFKPENLFSDDLLNLARKRVLRDGIVQGAYFDENCPKPAAVVASQAKVKPVTPAPNPTPEEPTAEAPLLSQKFVLSSPRTWRFGFGFNTEVGPFAETSWEHARFGSKAAHIYSHASVSFERQSLSADARYYPILARPRFFLAPEFQASRDIKEADIDIETSLALKPGYQFDFTPWALKWRAGPAYVINWKRPKKPTTSEYHRDGSLALQGEMTLQTHTYELYDAHPQSGFLLTNAVDYRPSELGFFTSTFNFDQTAKWSALLGYCLEARCYFAWRHRAEFTLIRDPNNNLRRLPKTMQTYLGDVPSLRGFKTERLPNPGITSLSEGIEVRFNGLFMSSLEPYLFTDAGKLGFENLSLAQGTYVAPGLGLRWFSPVGIVNGFVTRSVATQHTIPNEWYFYVGLGDGF